MSSFVKLLQCVLLRCLTVEFWDLSFCCCTLLAGRHCFIIPSLQNLNLSESVKIWGFLLCLLCLLLLCRQRNANIYLTSHTSVSWKKSWVVLKHQHFTYLWIMTLCPCQPANQLIPAVAKCCLEPTLHIHVNMRYSNWTVQQFWPIVSTQPNEHDHYSCL